MPTRTHAQKVSNASCPSRPGCPSYRDHRWECARGQDNLYHCYERCPADYEERDFHRCYDTFDSC